MKWYQTKWWYVEGPHFPYILLLGWPFVWVWGFVHDLVDRRRERLWEPVPDGRATLRLWDKDFNLLATWKNGDPLYFTEDEVAGLRRSGLVTKVDFTNGCDFW